MNPWALFSLIVGVLAILVTIIIHTQSTIDKKIESKFQDADFIKKVASEVRLPFLVFDENKTYLADTGATNLIKDIRIVKEGKSIIEIIISPTKILPIAPILESYDRDIEFEEPIKGNQFDWIYKAIHRELSFAKKYPSGKVQPRRFKLQLVELAD